MWFRPIQEAWRKLNCMFNVWTCSFTASSSINPTSSITIVESIVVDKPSPSYATRKSSKSIFNMAEHPTNADAIADAKISPGDDYEEIREQVRSWWCWRQRARMNSNAFRIRFGIIYFFLQYRLEILCGLHEIHLLRWIYCLPTRKRWLVLAV